MKGAIQKYFAPCNNNSQVTKHKRSRSNDVIEISSDDDFKPKIEKRKRKLRKSDGKQTKSPKLKNGHSSAAAKKTTIKTPSLLDHGVTSNKDIVELVKTEVIDLDLEPETSPKKGENVSKPFKTIKQGKLQSEDCKSVEGASITAQKNFLKMNLSQKSQSKTDNKKLGDNTGQKVGDLSNNTEKVGGKESVGKRAYYLENFEMVVNSVQQNRDDWRLFEGEDQSCVNMFQQLHVNARKLYVRLFNRKYAWLPINKISYPEISPNPCPYLEMLASHDFLQSSMNEILSLQEILGLLSAPDVKVLAKSFRLSVQGPKPKICDAIESMCKKQKSVFTTSSGQLTSTVTKQALSLLGTCYRINRNVKKVFNRLLLVFDVTKGTEDDTDFTISIHSSNNLQHRKHQQLSAVLMEGMGRVAYPRYEVNRPTPIFGNRDELLEYEIAYQFLIDAISASDVSQWKVADDVCTQATERTPPTPCNKQLPVFLRCFTAQAVYVKVQSLHVSLLY
nr:fanconi-associated nuclease 1-like [Ciona intestinalis]|eukprot:XP_026694574.1 fanconi-associated nuclease 1-like [Ciona intestinalis]